jgi:hypothetical protein
MTMRLMPATPARKIHHLALFGAGCFADCDDRSAVGRKPGRESGLAVGNRLESVSRFSRFKSARRSEACW